jgi:proteic killer suppression protein
MNDQTNTNYEDELQLLAHAQAELAARIEACKKAGHHAALESFPQIWQTVLFVIATSYFQKDDKCNGLIFLVQFFQKGHLLYLVSIRDTILLMIKSFSHKGIKLFFETGSKSGIQAQHANKLARQLTLLNNAKTPKEMDIAGWRFHPLSHQLEGHYAIWVDKNWRLTFRFDVDDAELVDYQDYH